MRKFLLLTCILLGNFVLLSAQNNVLQVNGMVVTLDNNPISGATAELFADNIKVKTITTTSDGMFSFTLDYGKAYKIIVTKSGMIKKRIDFNTKVPAEDQRKLIKEFAMTLVESCEGSDISVFDEPVDMVEYDQGFGNFVSNKDYFEKMQAKLKAAYQKIDKCKQDKYNNSRNAAEQAMKDGKYDEAKKLYEQILQIYPNDAYSKRQIIQANKNIAKQEQSEARYNQLIKEADQFLANNQLTAAKQRYADATKLKPGESYPQQQITQINTTEAQQAEVQQKQQALDNQYDDLVTKANAAMATKNFPVARQLFEQAAKLKPNEAFPAQKIAEAQQAIQKQEQAKVEQEKNDKAYQDAVTQAQAAMQKGDYQQAQKLFQTALTYKPNEALPRQSINEVQRLQALKKQQELQAQKDEVDRQYSEAVQKADGLLAQKEYKNAISAYNDALVIKPSDTYASQQIAKIQNLLVEEQQKQQVAAEQAYNQAMVLGDAKKLSQEYDAAISAYQQALQAKPKDVTAQNKLSEAKKLYDSQQAQLKEETEKKAQFKQLVQEGDGLYQSQKYAEARAKYQQALTMYPFETYPKNQIAAIDNIQAKNQKTADYNNVIAQADQLFVQKKYDEAIAQYSAAMQIDPSQQYPQQKINEINKARSDAAAQETRNKYDKIAAQAEEQIKQKNFDQAKGLYAQAQLVMPANPYPKQRINEINAMIDDQARGQKSEEYDKAISQADQLLAKKDFDAAKKQYGVAAQIDPTQSYPQQKINEINKLISDVAKQKVVDQYTTVIQQGDNLLSHKNYNGAIAAYQNALKIMPDQQYPQQKINEINGMLAEAARQDQAEQDKQNAYNQTVELADKYYNDKNYILATSQYNKALAILPDETYPKTQLDKIQQEVQQAQQEEAQKKDLEQKFKSAIAQGDQLFKDRKYLDAKTYYQQANQLKPDDPHSSSQIQRIDDILAQQAADQQKIDATNKKYNDLIASADSKYSSKDYKDARHLYFASLEVKPNETYPRDQIKKIDDEIKQMVSSQKVGNTTTSSTSSTTVNANVTSAKTHEKLADLSFINESKRAKYLNGLKNKYSEGVSLEVYKEGNKTTKRYIVIRSGKVHEFREIFFTWGGHQYSVDGKPSNSLYLQSQVKPREGEKFTQVEK